MTSIVPELQSLAPSAIIELFELHTSTELHGSSEIFRFHSGANQRIANGDVVWAGNRYQRFPIEATGFEYNGKQLPRPTLRVANLFSVITAVLLNVNELTPGNDLIGAKVIRIRTCARYLDAVNFESNVNPYGSPDPTAEAPREIYFVDRKVAENRDYVEFELAAAIDLMNVKLPGRQCISSVCQWVYRGPDCGYTGTSAFDENDEPANLVAAPNFAAGTNTLSPGQSLLPNQSLVSANAWYKLVMQTDGNLVIYNKAAKPVWNTLTGGKGLSVFDFQTDGNLVVFKLNDSNQTTRVGATWNSNTENQATIGSLVFSQLLPPEGPKGDNADAPWVPATDFPAGTSSVSSAGSGFRLNPGDFLTSANRWYRLTMERDGRLTIRNKSDWPVWVRGDNTQPGSFAQFQPDGNLVVYKPDGGVSFASGAVLATPSTSPATNFATGTGVLLAGGTSTSRIAAGQDLFTSNGWYKLAMESGDLVLRNKAGIKVWSLRNSNSNATYAQFQADGNLVLYDNSGNTYGQTNNGGYAVSAGKRLALQPDGNLVIYGIGGTSTSTVPAPNFPAGTGKIFPGNTNSSRLYKGQVLYSANGWYRLQMQEDGNLVITNKAGIVTWSTGTYGTAAHFAAFQPDGNLVLYASDGVTAIWYSNNGSYPINIGTVWVLDNSGEFVLFEANNLPLWRSYTGRTQEPTVTVTNQTTDTPLWSTNTGTSTEPVNKTYATATLTMQGDGNLVVSSNGTNLWTAGIYFTTEPGNKLETYDNRLLTFLWEIFGSADTQVNVTKSVIKVFTFGVRTLTVTFNGTANVTLPANHYSGQTKTWLLNTETYTSSTGKWYLDEIIDAYIQSSATNPFKFHPAGIIDATGRKYRVTGVTSSTGVLTLQNDGNLVLKDANNTPVWDAGYVSAVEPKVPGDGTGQRDVCGKRLSSCEVRFGPNVDLPFGSFPGVGQYFV